ncbi:hypothetical protein SR42_15245 [Clostridium botulinum]|uniref:hypothetical protein n=1 Tax=Clostridium botulinum TaxID=1491 RepID=UPI00059760D5|nr:hypothetical protein [Clostridium botulinum]KIL06919.1 hypothetical protein SR42_15245 [Clostridium botulinum]MBY6935279.1 hypothetical protein [Clostridium botulinum]NFI51650.1 hypothetical protein [Clostridium botulinum]NFL82088.1 hypothetical protein [Clostridium botulinum]NFN12677.1 hypothetical protein [Clostridium botulinum]
MNGKFIYPAPNNKNPFDVEIVSFDGKGNGEIICPECNNKINGKYYSWYCNRCGIEYLGPLLEK